MADTNIIFDATPDQSTIRRKRTPTIEMARAFAKGVKCCSICTETKPLSAFNLSARSKWGLASWCRMCTAEKIKSRYSREGQKAAQAHRMRLASYGISRPRFDAMLIEQAGLCKVCDSPMGPGLRELHVDHRHTTGHIRGLLCRGCNIAIGMSGESPERLRLLASYLEYNDR